jgi:hypothetical protein
MARNEPDNAGITRPWRPQPTLRMYGANQPP